MNLVTNKFRCMSLIFVGLGMASLTIPISAFALNELEESCSAKLMRHTKIEPTEYFSPSTTFDSTYLFTSLADGSQVVFTTIEDPPLSHSYTELMKLIQFDGQRFALTTLRSNRFSHSQDPWQFVSTPGRSVAIQTILSYAMGRAIVYNLSTNRSFDLPLFQRSALMQPGYSSNGPSGPSVSGDTVPSQIVAPSRNGHFVISVDSRERINRLDVDSGQILKSSGSLLPNPFRSKNPYLGGSVRDDGSVVMITRASDRVEFDSQLKEISRHRAPPFALDYARNWQANVSPDGRQAIFFFDYGGDSTKSAVAFVDYEKNTAIVRTGDKSNVVWNDRALVAGGWLFSRDFEAVPRPLSSSGGIGGNRYIGEIAAQDPAVLTLTDLKKTALGTSIKLERTELVASATYKENLLVTVSPDGSKAIIRGRFFEAKNSAEVFDLHTGKLIRTLNFGSDWALFSSSFSSDSSGLVLEMINGYKTRQIRLLKL